MRRRFGLERRRAADAPGDRRQALGLSRERVRQIESRAKEKLRRGPKAGRAAELLELISIRPVLWHESVGSHGLCPICDDTRWKIVERDGVRRAVRCDCWREASAGARCSTRRASRTATQHCDLDNFVAYPNEKLLNVVARARRFAEAFPVVDKGLFLIGPPGIGKSHLAVAVLKAVIGTRGARGLFYDVRELLKVIRSTYDPVVKTTEAEVLRPVMQTDLLVLDDIGAEKTSEWVEETLNLIVNTRYSERRLTIFTSNYEEKEDRTDPDSLLARVGFRMHSRLYEMCEFLEYRRSRLPPRAARRRPATTLLAMWASRQKGRSSPPAAPLGSPRSARSCASPAATCPGPAAGQGRGGQGRHGARENGERRISNGDVH